MSTDLRAALRAVTAEEPFDASDPDAVVRAGERRVRRRAGVVLGAVVLAVAATAGGLATMSDGSDPAPRPAHVVTLDLDSAPHRELDVLGTVRTTWQDSRDADLDGDTFLGLTTDGLVLRSRYSWPDGTTELGLLDPATGRTRWLPPAVTGAGSAVELTADRLVMFEHDRPSRAAVAVFDRRTSTWTSTELRLERGLEAHIPFRVALAPDGRLYLGSTYEGESTLHWWSFSVPEGGEGRSEPALEGAGVAWSDGQQITATGDGRVVVTDEAGDRVVAEDRPEGCEAEIGVNAPSMPVVVALAGDRPVVTYWCLDQQRPLTVVYSADGSEAVQVPGAGILAVDGEHVLLGGGGTYLFDLDDDAMVRIAPRGQEYEYDLEGGLALWNNVGPIEDRDTYDVVWNVARLR